jgi:hypothetical protein
MVPGETVTDWNEAIAVVDVPWNTERGVWMKLPGGSGGDLCQRIPMKATIEDIALARERLRLAIRRSFDENRFSQTMEQYWPHDAFSPTGFPFVIEADVHLQGEQCINIGTQFITEKNGGVHIIGHYDQITTDEGEYLGNEPSTSLTNEMQQLIEEQVQRVAAYSMKENHYFGIQGVDLFLVHESEGWRAYISELNSRPTANTPPVIIAQKLGAPHWINTNIYTDTPFEQMDDYIETVGKDLTYGSWESGAVIPQAFRTLVRRGNTIASPNCKIVILGRDAQHCREIQNQMIARGIRFTP